MSVVSAGTRAPRFHLTLGDVVIWDAQDPTITIAFTSAISSFDIWYTSYDPLTLQAFGIGNKLLGGVVGQPNMDGTTGSFSMISFTGAGIETIDLTSTPGLFVLDDLTYQAADVATPEPASISLVASVGLCLLAATAYRTTRRRN